MSLQPMSRNAMNQLRIDRFEENMRNVIIGIYYPAVECAQRTDKTVYHHMVPFGYEFYKNNMPEILKRLQVLFPECQVSHTLLSHGSDGKLYDISKIDDKDLHLVDTVSENSYILIDWA